VRGCAAAETATSASAVDDKLAALEVAPPKKDAAFPSEISRCTQCRAAENAALTPILSAELARPTAPAVAEPMAGDRGEGMAAERRTKSGSEERKAADGMAAQKLCVISFARPRTMIVLPCMHLCLCDECARPLQTSLSLRCPIDNSPFASIQRVYEPLQSPF